MEKILVIDDEIENLKILDLYLKQRGYSTILSSYPKDAISIIEKEGPDLIILDIMMPEIDGFTLCKMIKEKDNIKDIPIIFLTARYLDKKDLVTGLNLGAIDYITKPFDENELFARINTALKIKQVEKKLKQERDFLDTILNSVGSEIIIIDSERTISLANNSFLKKRGLNLDDIIGKKCYDLTFGKDFCLKDGGCPVAESFEGKATRDIIEVPTESGIRYINISSYPIYDLDGKINKIVEIQEDITGEVLKEKQIQQINSLLENIISRMSEGLLFVNVNKEIIKMNDKAKKIIDKAGSFRESKLFYIDDISIDEIFNSIADSKKENTYTKIFTLDDNYYKLSASPLIFNNQECVIITFNDITSELKTQEELIQSAKLVSIGELAANIAHEINNPITGIIGYAELLTFYKDLVPKKVLDVVDKIQRESFRVKNIIENLLKFSRKQQIMDMSYTDISSTLKEVSFLISASFEENNIHLEIDIEDNLPLVYCNSGLIQQVVLNLLQNAFDAITSGGKGNKVKLEAKKIDDNNVVLTVSDNGHGIPENIKDKIFQPFFTTKSQGKGTGLGLSLVHRIIQMHKGTISFETSKNGTTFKIQLPITIKKEEKITDNIDDKTSFKPDEFKKALVIDDDTTVREYLSDILFTFKYRVDEAKDAQSAVKLMKHNTYDVIILDNRLPDKDGTELFYDLLKENEELAKRVVFITGEVSLDTREKLKKTGRPFLIKPFSFNDLISILGIK